MTPEQLQQLNKLVDLYYRTNFPDKVIFQNPVYFNNGIFGGLNGIKIGKSTDKLGVYGVTPVVQASAITAPSGGATVDTQSRTAISSIITALKNFGITL